MLVLLQSVPDVKNQELLLPWSFNHWVEHQNIAASIQSTYTVNLEQYQLDPIPANDLNTWLANHQQMHDDFNAILGYPGADLQDVDVNDPQQREYWAFLHWLEHSNANTVLNIG